MTDEYTGTTLNLSLNRKLGVFLAILIGLGGCKGVYRFLGEDTRPRNGEYDTSPDPAPLPRLEPYAVYSGKASDGESLYLIHWKGNRLDMTGATEKIVDALDIQKYQN